MTEEKIPACYPNYTDDWQWERDEVKEMWRKKQKQIDHNSTDNNA